MYPKKIIPTDLSYSGTYYELKEGDCSEESFVERIESLNLHQARFILIKFLKSNGFRGMAIKGYLGQPKLALTEFCEKGLLTI